MRTIRPWLIAGMLTVTTINADADPVVYTDEASYIEALSAGGYETLLENFEDDVVWADSRSTISNPAGTPQVNSQGILWSSNFATTNNIATSSAGVAGTFGFYSSPHGDPNVETSDFVCDVADPIPEQCFLHDGFVGTSEGAGTLYGVGIWIDGTFGADVTLFLDGVEVGFGADGNISSWTFLGVIDTAGFNSFEFREIDGKGAQGIFIFADDVTFGVSAVPVPNSDADGDGVADQLDNCTVTQNADQLDTDGDGYGNLCDADLDNTGFVDFSDMTVFSDVFFTADADADFDGSGFVDFSDLTIFEALFFQPSGPSCCGIPLP